MNSCLKVSTCQTELLSRVSEPFVSFKLHVLPAGETKTRPIEFHCDINQFQVRFETATGKHFVGMYCGASRGPKYNVFLKKFYFNHLN